MENDLVQVQLAFGKTIRQLRKQRRCRKYGSTFGPMTQGEVAHAVGLDRSYITALERGDHNPTLSTIWRLLPALRVTPVQFMRELDRNFKDLVAR